MTFKLAKKNFLITGGTGQIGSFLTEKLLANEANVTVIGRNIDNLKEIKYLVDTKKIKFIECDLTNENRIKTIGPLLQNVDFLVHLSSELKFSEPKSISSAHHTVELDAKGTILLLQQLKQLQGILFTSSVAVYGKPSYMPTDELCPIRPISFYGCGKFATEKYLKLHSGNNDIPLTILRVSTVYGQRNRSDQMIPIFTRKALRNEPIKLYGNSSRDFIHISDVIEAIMSAIKLNQNNLFNIGTGIKLSNHFILKKIIEITKSQSEILRLEKSKDAQYDFITDISKATAKLGVNPKVSIERGLVDEISWHNRFIKTIKKTDSRLKYSKLAAQKFSNNSRIYSMGKSFYRTFFKIYPNSIHILPDFIIFAEGRCGTTSLYEGIVEHPNVHRALQKETYFFDAEFQRGVGWYKHHFPFVWKKYLSTKIQGKKFLTGEATPRYCIHPYAPKRAYELIPKVKLIALLRNPIDKALSAYHFQVTNGRESLSFEDGLKEEESRIGGEMEKMEKDENYYSANFFRYSYLTRGIYINGLKKWMNAFPRDQFFFQDSESFFKNPSTTLNQIYEFLNLPKFQTKQHLHYNSIKYPSMKPETRKLLIEHFKPYNEKLYKLIGKSFDWDK